MPRATNRRIAATIAATALVAAGLVAGTGTASAADTSSAGSLENSWGCGRNAAQFSPTFCVVFGYAFIVPDWVMS
ncbi:hypothetical protein [Rhodococcus sp. Q]|uniref:hypothetical protein n=1 Tax=Rhodococcus sp. Q TaxID=2502252 RepID=UPI0010F48289|nr:hypothetical protein [Rhodococcus sp. Q]